MRELTDLPAIATNNVKIIPRQFLVCISDKKINLTRLEFLLLYLLVSRPKQVFSDFQIIEYIHGENIIRSKSTIKVLICSLRTKLGSFAKHIVTVHGIGVKYQ